MVLKVPQGQKAQASSCRRAWQSRKSGRCRAKGLSFTTGVCTLAGDFMSQGRKTNSFLPGVSYSQCQRLWSVGSEIHCTSIRGLAQEQEEWVDQEGLIPLFSSCWTGRGHSWNAYGWKRERRGERAGEQEGRD